MSGRRRGRRQSDEASSAAERDPGDEPRRRSLKPLLVLKPYMMRHGGVLALAALAMVVSALAMLSVPLAVRRMIDFGFTGGNGAFIDRYFGMLAAIGAVLALASAARFYFVNWLGERVVADVRGDVFAHLTRLGPAFHDKAIAGELMSRLAADTTLIKGAAGSAVSQAVRNIIMLVGALTMMVVTSPRLALLALGAIPLIVLPLMAYGRLVRRLSRHAQDTLADATGVAGEGLGAIRTVQSFGAEAALAERYRGSVERAFAAADRRMRARAGLTALVILLLVFSIVGVLWYGAGLVIAGEISGGRLSQFVLYALLAAGALAELSEVWGEVSQAAGAAERLAEILASEPDIASPPVPVPLPVPARGAIEFDRVRYAYPAAPGVPVLDGFSLRIAPGERVALVGSSGAGKSTVIALLQRFRDPQSGRVLVDGVDIRAAELGELRRRMALVPQDVVLLSDSVAENIRFGACEASRQNIEQAARAAQADEFIRHLPQGYDTPLGERGVTLSGGQRQRIAIARALLRDCPILLLDEATSALDAESEEAVQRALETAMRGRTTLVVAHRLSTVQRADRIVVLDKGRIVEEGTHAKLLAAGGLYARLAELQLGLAQAAQ